MISNYMFLLSNLKVNSSLDVGRVSRQLKNSLSIIIIKLNSLIQFAQMNKVCNYDAKCLTNKVPPSVFPMFSISGIYLGVRKHFSGPLKFNGPLKCFLKAL